MHTFRTQGVLPNNEWTISITLATVTIESLVFSAGVTETVARLREKAQVTELAYLRAQIKPGFIYAALNAVGESVQKDMSKSVGLLNDLSQFLRSNFDFETSNQRVTLDQEVSLVQAYWNIEKASLNQPVQLDISCDPALRFIQIPSLILQPLVENAIRHGFSDSTPEGHIRVRITHYNQDVLLSVEDNGTGIAAEKLTALNNPDDPLRTRELDRTAMGLQNIRRRLKVSSKSQLVIDSTPGNGTRVTIRFKGLLDT